MKNQNLKLLDIKKVILNWAGVRLALQHLPRMSWTLRNNNDKSGRFQIKFGMTFFNNAASGFTLIELLVVVLIIGILAAVALPQYQAVVDRTTVNAYTSMLNKYVQAQELYYIENGEYAREFNALDVDFSNLCSDKFHNILFGCKGPAYIDLVYTGKIPGYLYLSFCPSFGQTTSVYNYPQCLRNSTATFYWYFAHYDEKGTCVSCSYGTKRGKKLCDWFLSLNR